MMDGDSVQPWGCSNVWWWLYFFYWDLRWGPKSPRRFTLTVWSARNSTNTIGCDRRIEETDSTRAKVGCNVKQLEGKEGNGSLLGEREKEVVKCGTRQQLRCRFPHAFYGPLLLLFLTFFGTRDSHFLWAIFTCSHLSLAMKRVVAST